MPRARIAVLIAAAGAAVTAVAAPALAQTPAGAPMPFETPAARVVTCAACHGVNGNSKSDAMPIIAGMDAAYFKKQIQSYSTNGRPSPEMGPYAKQVLDIGVDVVAGYFAAQRMEPTPVKVDAAAVERGRVASTPCVICHGANGKGDAAKGIPSLAGQPPAYLREQIRLFKLDTRNPGDATIAAMKALMKTIPEGQEADLAAYYSSLR
jgi:cytochrome c553